jgi:hypothetical protein
MSLLELAQMEAPKADLLPEGEYRVTIESAEPKQFNSGRTGYALRLSFPDQPDADSIFHNIFELKEDDPRRTVSAMVNNAKQFQAAFGITNDNVETWIGLEGWATVTAEEYEGVTRNKISKFLVGK